MATRKTKPQIVRPWVAHYPAGIAWDARMDTTPVHEQVLAMCTRQGHLPALDFLGAKTSFASLGRQIRAFAGALQQQYGVKKGSRVALLLPNTPFYPIAYYAVLLCGATVVNCNPLYTPNELGHILADAKAEILVTLDLKSIYEKAEPLMAEGHIREIVVCHFPDCLPLVKKLLFSVAKASDLARPSGPHIQWYDKLVRLGLKAEPVAIDSEKDAAVQQYTGGTTGLPKGAMLSHANVAANASQIDAWAGGLFDPPSKIVAVLPFFHIFAMTVCMNVPLGRGAQVIMLPRFELRAIIDLFVRTRANVLPAVPTLLHAIATGAASRGEHFASLEVAISGGAALSDAIRKEFTAISPALLAEGYGLTECSPVVSCAALREASKPMSIGQPLPATDIRFADIETGKPLPYGEKGELQVKGPQVMLGYYNNDEATKEAFVDGWFRTGDVGYVDAEGFIFLVDRIKDLIICSGFNVYPRMIEEAILKHPAIDECNVIGVKDNYRGEAPAAFVTLKAGAKATASEIKQFLTDNLSKLEMPRDIFFMDKLPKTLVGKMDKKALRVEFERMKEKNREQV